MSIIDLSHCLSNYVAKDINIARPLKFYCWIYMYIPGHVWSMLGMRSLGRASESPS